jgi:hypothetical protein
MIPTSARNNTALQTEFIFADIRRGGNIRAQKCQETHNVSLAGI